MRTRVERLWPLLALALVAAIVLLSFPYLESAYYLEAGGRAMEDGGRAEQLLNKAIAWDSNNAQAYRLLAKAYGVQVNWEGAARALRVSVQLRQDNPLGHLELAEVYEALAVADASTEKQDLEALIADEWRRAGLTEEDCLKAGKLALTAGQDDSAGMWFERAIRLRPNWEEAYRSLGKTTRGDAIALVHLEGGSQQDLEKFGWLRPGDLYMNYQLWRQARETGNPANAQIYSEALAHFPIEAIQPTEERLLDYALAIVPFLLEDGIWSRDTLLNVVAFLAWQRPEAASVEQLLLQLSERNPNEADWLFYLGEVYHRRAMWEPAQATYLKTLAVDPGYAQAHLRLGMISEARCKAQVAGCASLTAAAEQYQEYHRTCPHDVHGLERLARVLEVLGRPEAAALSEELLAGTDSRLFVAEALGLPPEDVELGPNLVSNGDFGIWDDQHPAEWSAATYLGPSGDRGLYTMGKDELVAGGSSARILALWGGLLPDGTITYAEYLGERAPIADAKYLVSLYYSSQRFVEGSGLFIVGEYDKVGGLKLAQESLSDSQGQWQWVHILAEPANPSTAVGPLVRVAGVGEQWIQSVAIRSIIIH